MLHIGSFTVKSTLKLRQFAVMSGRYADAHANRAGPGDARPTALQIVKDEGVQGALKGKSVLITGASSGIGIETARALHATGAKIFLAVRDTEKAQSVAQDIEGNSNAQQIEVIKLHLDSLASVREAAQTFLSKHEKLNILINNAGVMATPEGKTADGFETQFGTNHLGHFLLFQLLKPALLAAATPEFSSRVVSLSSVGHRSSPVRFDDYNFEKEPYNTWSAYGQSKTANIYLATEIERRYGSQGLHATALHPGGIFTNLGRHLDPSFMEGFKQGEFMKMVKSPEQGAATTVWAAIGKDWENKGGKYLEECSISEPVDPSKKPEELTPLIPGYSSYIYDTDAASKLWDLSNKLVGFEE